MQENRTEVNYYNVSDGKSLKVTKQIKIDFIYEIVPTPEPDPTLRFNQAAVDEIKRQSKHKVFKTINVVDN